MAYFAAAQRAQLPCTYCCDEFVHLTFDNHYSPGDHDSDDNSPVLTPGVISRAWPLPPCPGVRPLLSPSPRPRPGLTPLLSRQDDPGPALPPRRRRLLPSIPVMEIVVVIVVVVVVVSPVVGGGPGVVVVVVSVVCVVVSDVIERWELVANLSQKPVLLPNGSSNDSALKRGKTIFKVKCQTQNVSPEKPPMRKRMTRTYDQKLQQQESQQVSHCLQAPQSSAPAPAPASASLTGSIVE